MKAVVVEQYDTIYNIPLRDEFAVHLTEGLAAKPSRKKAEKPPAK